MLGGRDVKMIRMGLYLVYLSARSELLSIVDLRIIFVLSTVREPLSKTLEDNSETK